MTPHKPSVWAIDQRFRTVDQRMTSPRIGSRPALLDGCQPYAIASLALDGRQIIRRRMSADGVVKHFNVAKRITARFLPGGVDLLADALPR